MVLHLSDWIYILKVILKSKQSENSLKKTIRSTCLMSPPKMFGSYMVDGEKVWSNIIQKDYDMLSKLEELNIHDSIGILSYYEEVLYMHMRWTYPRRRHKKGG